MFTNWSIISEYCQTNLIGYFYVMAAATNSQSALSSHSWKWWFWALVPYVRVYGCNFVRCVLQLAAKPLFLAWKKFCRPKNCRANKKIFDTCQRSKFCLQKYCFYFVSIFSWVSQEVVSFVVGPIFVVFELTLTKSKTIRRSDFFDRSYLKFAFLFSKLLCCKTQNRDRLWKRELTS